MENEHVNKRECEAAGAEIGLGGRISQQPQARKLKAATLPPVFVISLAQLTPPSSPPPPRLGEEGAPARGVKHTSVPEQRRHGAREGQRPPFFVFLCFSLFPTDASKTAEISRARHRSGWFPSPRNDLARLHRLRRRLLAAGPRSARPLTLRN